MHRITLSLIAASLSCLSVSAAATVFTADFIDDGSRTNFNGFEGLTGGAGLPSTYTEDGIVVDQILGRGNNIWSTCNSCWDNAMDGGRSWYPNGGDFGYTRITRSGGLDFENVGFLVSSGRPFPLFLYFELWKNGVMKRSGELPHALGR